MKTATYFVLTVVGGAVVLGSYAYGATTHAERQSTCCRSEDPKTGLWEIPATTEDWGG